MTPAAAVTLGGIVLSFIIMMLGIATPDIALLGILVCFTTFEIIEPNIAFSGFSNTGMLTIAGLFIVASGVRETGVLTQVSGRIFGHPKSERGALMRLIAPTVVASAFLNNTTIVATLLPVVSDWSKRIQIPIAKLLMPLSFASILGGMCTLIGTSTNLVVAGLVEDLKATHPTLRSIEMFDITSAACIVVILGSIIIIVLAPLLLTNRKPPISTSDDPKEYTMELLIPMGSSIHEKTIEQAGLRHLPNAFLMEIIRGDDVLPAVAATTKLLEEDRLIFVGDIDAMVDLQRFPGLAAAPDQVYKLDGPRLRREIIEAVVSKRNPYIGQTIRETGFRTHYKAVIIAVARSNQRVEGRIGDIILEPGDVLLLEAPNDFLKAQRNRNDFILVSSIQGAKPPRFERAGIAGIILTALVLSIALNILPPVTSTFLAAGAMILTKCCTMMEARSSLDLSVLVTIASAFGLGATVSHTGLDLWIAEHFIAFGIQTPYGALIGIYALTFVLTELITNSAAAVLTVPIGIVLAEQVGASPMPFVFAIMIAASSSFLTPIGYQTNLMVLNAGGYHPLDYTKLGAPLTLVVAIVSLIMIPQLWPFALL